MPLLMLAFLAGALTVAAPCILPLLPVVLTGTVGGGKQDNWSRPLIIIASLSVSIFVFSLLLKATTTLIGVPQQVWQVISGVIVTLFGLNYLFPGIWQQFAVRSGLSGKTGATLQAATTTRGYKGEILLGAALGPVFNSCSPTYALIVAAILPVSLATGVTYLMAYVLGLAVALLLVAWLGRSVVNKFGWAVNEHGWFRILLGLVLLVVGLSVLFGFDKKVQAYVLEKGWYDPISNLEQRF